ncbi:MAG: glycosyltransferase [Ruminococcus sp.]|jgi:glycosyltransferase involved in cell wall biosynthesis|nr:glycosyltransferase [Ruminococcus sp.]
MEMIQLLPTLSFGDAVGNDTIALKGAIRNMGFKTSIYAENVDARLPKNTGENISKLKGVSKDDVIIYHKSTGTDLSFKIPEYKCRKIMIYHNITPSEFFRPYNSIAVSLTEYGLEGVKYLSDKVDYCLADSSFNKSELIKAGYKCPIDVRPILIPFDDYKKKPDEEIVRKFSSDGYVNIIFVGRIAPNKKHENIIRAFCQYKKINPKSRLFLVGSYSGMENYYERLLKYVKALELDDVYFTGHIKFNQILAYYRIADIFLCMSEHEGFCVPLVEAMFFNVPIIAYDTSAISDTLGGSGILINDNDPLFTAMLIDKLVNDDILRSRVIEKQKSRLEDFRYEKIRDMFEMYLKNFLGK